MIQNKIGSISLYLLLLVSLICLQGCKKSTAIKTDLVTGVVQMNGSPLVGAMVTFLPVDSGNTAIGTTDANGKYTLQTLLGAADAGTTPGDYIVTISKKENRSTGQQEWSESAGEMVDIMSAHEQVPEKFTNKSSTPLKATVVAGQANSFDFDVSN